MRDLGFSRIGFGRFRFVPIGNNWKHKTFGSLCLSSTRQFSASLEQPKQPAQNQSNANDCETQINVDCGPSVLDLRAANDAIRVVRQVQSIRKGPPTAVLIPNKLQIQTRLSQELLETAKTLEIPTGPALRLRQAYADAVGQGTVVWKMGPRALDAAIEMKRLFEELLPDEIAKTDERRLGNG